MKTFKYSALDDGEKVTGIVEAMDEYDAAENIKGKYPVILKLTEIKNKKSILDKNLTRIFNDKVLAVISSEMGTILNAGVDISTCIEMIAGNMKNKKVKRMLLNTAKDIDDGNSLAISLEKNCEDIPPTFIASVHAGELTGRLDETFEILEKYYNRSYKSKEKLRQAFIYPIFVIIIAIIVLMVVMTKVIPTILGIFNNYNGKLPKLTVFLIKSSTFWAKWWSVVLFVFLAMLVGLRIYRHTERGRPWASKKDLERPVTGKILESTLCADFSITMEMLLKSGLPMTDALEITGNGMSNFILKKEILTFKDQVENGSRLGELMIKSEVIPDILSQMVTIGEETGELEKMLEKTGDYYTNETQNRINSALAKLEPAILVFLAIFAGFIVISIYLPMFTMYDFL